MHLFTWPVLLTVTSILSNDWENRQNAELNSFVLLTRLSQHWDNLFFATDGALSLNKCFLVFPFFGLGWVEMTSTYHTFCVQIKTSPETKWTDVYSKAQPTTFAINISLPHWQEQMPIGPSGSISIHKSDSQCLCLHWVRSSAPQSSCLLFVPHFLNCT
jgi:hypothetical protein